VLTTTRIGVAYAGADWADRPWRFTIAGHPSVSGPRAG
jgi:3-methyladenine DNA glycosylase Mpg